MTNPVLRWSKSPSSNVTAYAVQWTVNGALIGSGSVPQSAGGDRNGYAADFAGGNRGIVLGPGDLVGASVVAVDTVNGLSSSPVTASPVTIPLEAPEPPENVTLALS